MTRKKILVPLDFSECSLNALHAAIRIAKKLDNDLLLLHTYHVPASFNDVTIPDLYEFARSKAEEQFEEVENSVSELNSVSYEILMDYALAPDFIKLTSTRYEVSLIIMGTMGATGLNEIFIGSNTYEVVKVSKCPVLAIPKNARTNDISNIALAVDYHEVPGREVFESLIELARIYDSEIHILNVSKSTVIADGEADEARKFERYFKQVDHNYNYELDEDVEEGINAYLTNHDIDILVLIRRHHNLIDRLFKKNITKKMVYHTDIPLLVLPEIK